MQDEQPDMPSVDSKRQSLSEIVIFPVLVGPLLVYLPMVVALRPELDLGLYGLLYAYFIGAIPAFAGGILAAVAFRRLQRLSYFVSFWCGVAGLLLVFMAPPLLRSQSSFRVSLQIAIAFLPIATILGGLPAILVRALAGRFMTLHPALSPRSRLTKAKDLALTTITAAIMSAGSSWLLERAFNVT